MTRAPCCEKAEVRKGPWTPEEDELLVTYVREHGEGNWSTVPKKAGLIRCGKSCRLRWANYLRPDLKRGTFTIEEETLIINLHQSIGNRWAKIATELPGRTDNDIKNHWNTRLKKRLREEGIDPDTHMPLSTMTTDEAVNKEKTPVKRATPGPPPEKGPNKKQKVSESSKFPLLGQFSGFDLSRVVCDEKLMLCWPTEEDLGGAAAPLSSRSEHSDAESGVESGSLPALKLEDLKMDGLGMKSEESLGASQDSESADHPDSPTSVIREAVALLKSGAFGQIPPGGFLSNAFLGSSGTKPPRPKFQTPSLTIPPPNFDLPSGPPVGANGGTLVSPFLLKNLWGEGSDEFWSEADLEATALHLPSPHILPTNAAGLSSNMPASKALLGDLTAFDSLPSQNLSQVPREKTPRGSSAAEEELRAIKVDCSGDFDAMELFQNNAFSPLCKVGPLSPWPDSFISPRNWPAIDASSILNLADAEKQLGTGTESDLPSLPKLGVFGTSSGAALDMA